MSNQTKLKALMVKHDLRQEDVAKLIFVSRQTVAKGLIQPDSARLAHLHPI